MSNVGRYRVLRRLGSGGMAEVLEAEAFGDAGFVRRVAIKRMLGTAKEDPSFARMFLDEARIASRLHHANIVSVLDYGVVDGAPFQVLELVEGVDARTLIRRSENGKVPVDIALHLVVQIGHALAAAHDATDITGEPLGIVHRDVSPGNVLVSWDGDVKLADFGIAFAKDKSEKTEAGTTKGTLVYMSPEQAITGRVDRRADVFSLGCVLHTLVTGASPLAGDNFTRFLSEQTIPIASGLPEDVRSIIEIATRYDKEERFQSAIALTEAAGRALAARIDREPRRRLVEYLAEFRARTTPAHTQRGRLDELLRVDIVVADDNPTVREFRTATTTAPAFDTTEHVLPPARAAMPLPAPTPTAQAMQAMRNMETVPRALAAPAPSSRAPWIAGSVIVLTLASSLGVAAWVLRTRGPAPSRTTTTIAPSAPSAPSAAPSAIASAASPPVPPTAAPSLAMAPPPSPSTRKTAPLRPAAPAPAAPVSACSGTVYLSCPLAPRAAITIDGAATAYHHGDFADVSCAAHAISFEAQDGRRSTRSGAPSSANTRTSPLEIRCGLD